MLTLVTSPWVYKAGVPALGFVIAIEELAASDPVLALLLAGGVAAALTSIGVAVSKTVKGIKRAYDTIRDFIDEVRERLARLETRVARIERNLGIPYDDVTGDDDDHHHP